MKLGLREANQHFSKAIKAVRAGKEVVLTERGQPIRTAAQTFTFVSADTHQTSVAEALGLRTQLVAS